MISGKEREAFVRFVDPVRHDGSVRIASMLACSIMAAVASIQSSGWVGERPSRENDWERKLEILIPLKRQAAAAGGAGSPPVGPGHQRHPNEIAAPRSSSALGLGRDMFLNGRAASLSHQGLLLSNSSLLRKAKHDEHCMMR
jgi:hypothetical protein